MKIKIGTNRIVFIFKNSVIKIGILSRGLLANYVEFINYINNRDIVAKTSMCCGILKQEKLHNLQCLERYVNENNIPNEFKHLYKYAIHNRMQVGQDKNNVWKFYDYEDVKYYFRKEYEK